MWNIGRQKEHFAFLYFDVSKLAFVDDFEKHVTFVLEEPLRRLIDVVVGSFIGAANDLWSCK
jgi:hypothetical protein